MAGRARRVLVFGGSGMLGSAVVRRAPEGFEAVGVDRAEADVTDPSAVARVVADTRPEFVVNCAAYANVDGCETNEEQAGAVNSVAPGILAGAAKKAGAGLLHISTDYVFDGTAASPYAEADPVAPLSAYGRTKLGGETAILASGLENWRIVRTSWLFGPDGKNFVDTMARLALKSPVLRVVGDQTGRPTYTLDLADALYALLAREPGMYHYSNTGEATWHELAVATVGELARLGAPVVTTSVVAIRTDEYPRAATPPRYSVLDTEKFERATGLVPPRWRDALSRYFAAYGERYLSIKEG